MFRPLSVSRPVCFALLINAWAIVGMAAAQSPVTDCETVSSFTNSFTGDFRFRGNMFAVANPGTLRSFAMDLDFSETADLYFSIFVRSGGTGNFQRARNDVAVTLTGQGRMFYGTTLSVTDLNLKLLPGNQYVLGVAWGANTITVFRDAETYPQPFSHGDILGAVGMSLGAEPPLNVPPQGILLGAFQGAAYIMELCFCSRYADIAPTIGDGNVELSDLLCVLDGYSDDEFCLDGDIFPCNPPDGIIELADLLAVLDAYADNPPCPDPCGP